jgi:hypothetical protein
VLQLHLAVRGHYAAQDSHNIFILKLIKQIPKACVFLIFLFPLFQYFAIWLNCVVKQTGILVSKAFNNNRSSECVQVNVKQYIKKENMRNEKLNVIIFWGILWPDLRHP